MPPPRISSPACICASLSQPVVSLQHPFPRRVHTWRIRRGERASASAPASGNTAVRQSETSGSRGEGRARARWINRRMGAGCSSGPPSVCPSVSLKVGKMAVLLWQGDWEALVTSASASSSSSSAAGSHEAERCSTEAQRRRRGRGPAMDRNTITIDGLPNQLSRPRGQRDRGTPGPGPLFGVTANISCWKANRKNYTNRAKMIHKTTKKRCKTSTKRHKTATKTHSDTK